MLLAPDIPFSSYAADFLDPSESAALFDYCYHQLDWQQKDIHIFGQTVAQPRLQCWMADEGVAYTYSKLTLSSAPWTTEITAIKDRIQAETGYYFNFVLLNLYRDGNDSMGWHADDERNLGPAPVVASLTLGANRDFQVKSKQHDSNTQPPERYNIALEDGSLFMMLPGFQQHYLHALPPRKRCSQPRINLTFRQIVA